MRRETITFSDGTQGLLEMPDLYAVLAEVGTIPSPEIAAVLRLLEGTGALEQQNQLQRLTGQKEYWMGLYEIARLCLSEPRLILKGKAGPGEITARDLSLNDVQGIYWQFFLGKHPRVGVEPSPNGIHLEGPTLPPSPGGDLPLPAE